MDIILQNLGARDRYNPSLYIWGDNAYGQLGDNRATKYYYSWQQIATGANHTIGIRSDGTLWGWGSGTAGQTGYNDLTQLSLSSPSQIGWGGRSWTSIGAGALNSYGIAEDGSLWAWGTGATGLLGDGTTTYRGIPLLISNNSWQSVIGGASHAMAIRNDGTLWVWGDNSYGQLGLGDSVNRSYPTQVDGSWIAITAGLKDANSLHSGAIKSDGTLWMWGRNDYGQLGLGDSIARSTPAQVGNASWTTISSRGLHTLAINTLGKLYSWGDGSAGALGQNNTTSSSVPVQVGTSNWSKVSSGTSQSYAITSDNKLYGWGSQFAAGLLGDNTNVDKSSPVLISTSYSSIVTGESFSVAINSDNVPIIWGNNTFGQLGDNTAVAKSSPIQVNAFTYDYANRPVFVGKDWIKVSANLSHIVAIKKDGTLWGWGNNDWGQLGLGTQYQFTSYSSPVQINSGKWSNVTTTTRGTLAIKTDGTLWVAGANMDDTLGTNSYETVGTVSDTKHYWKSISLSSAHALAIRQDGTLWSWGVNQVGQLGLGDSIYRSSPVLVSTMSWTSALATGTVNNAASLGLANGKLWFWGSANFNTGLVNTTWDLLIPGRTNSAVYNIPTQILSAETPETTPITSWTSIASASGGTSGNYSLGIAGVSGNRVLYAWGYNNYGIGDGTTAVKPSPVIIGAVNTFSKIAANYQNTMAIRGDNNTLWMWGRNDNGQGGINANVPAYRSSPVQVSGGQTWSATTSLLAPANAWVAATDATGQLYAWGYNHKGQLGQGNTSMRSQPTLIGGMSNVVQINVRSYDGLHVVKNDGTVWAWGSNLYGVLGLGDTVDRSFPTQLAGISAPSVIPDIISGHGDLQVQSWTMITGTNGILYAMGQSNLSPIQYNNGASFNSTPTQISASRMKQHATLTQMGSDSNWSAVSAGASHVVAIKTDGTVWAWGQNNNYQFNETLISASTPVQVLAANSSISSFSQISASVDNTLILSNGKLLGMGPGSASSNYQLGSKILTVKKSWTTIAATGSFTAAIRSDGVLFTWGDNTNLILASSATTGRSSPAQVNSIATSNSGTFPISNWTFVKAVNTAYSLNPLSDSVMIGLNNYTPYVWGSYSTSPLKFLTSGTYSPVFFDYSRNINNLTNIQAGGGAVIDASGNALLFGGSGPALIGYNASVSATISPAVVDLTDYLQRREHRFVNWSRINTVGTVAAGFKTDGTFWMWGAPLDTDGVLAIQSTATTSPWNIITTVKDTSFIDFYIGSGAANSTNLYAYAIDPSGSIWTWGRMAAPLNGEYLTGLRVGTSSPTLLAVAGSGWTAIAGSNTGTQYPSLLLSKNDGTLWSWGAYNVNTPLAAGVPPHFHVSMSQITSGIGPSPVFNAITKGGRLLAWGGDTTNYATGLSVAVAVSGPSMVTVNDLPWNTTEQPSWTLLGRGQGTTAWSSGNYGVTSNNDLYYLGGRNDSSGYPNSPVAPQYLTTPTRIRINPGSSWAQISSGDAWSLGRTVDGNLWFWGIQTAASLGMGVAYSFSTQIAASQYNAYYLTKEGYLFAVGTNTHGELGDFPLDSVNQTYSSPVQMGATKWSKVAAGAQHTLAIRPDGTLWGWGLNDKGQLGTGVAYNMSSPTQVGTSSWISIAAGKSYSLAVKADGTLWGWGYNGTQSQLLGNSAGHYSSPAQIGTDNTWTNVFTNNSSSLSPVAVGIQNDGSLWAWGTGSHVTGISTGTTLSWASINVGPSNGYGVTTTGDVYVWGANQYGQFGDGVGTDTTATGPIPRKVPLVSSASQVYSANNGVIVKDASGKIWGWGGQTVAPHLPLRNFTSFTQFSQSQGGNAVGYTHAAVLDSFGNIWTWGKNSTGELGDGTTLSRSFATLVSNQVTGLSLGIKYKYVAVSEGIVYAIAENQNKVYGWGLNSSGTLPGNTGSRSYPVQLTTPGWLDRFTTSWVSVTTTGGNGYHITWIDSQNRAWHHGSSINETTGAGHFAGTPYTTYSFTNEGMPSKFTRAWGGVVNQIGSYFMSDNYGKLWSWGMSNPYGTLGINVAGALGASRSYPVQVALNKSVVSIYQAFQNVIALASDGTLWGWGRNANYELGQGDTFARSSPVQIASGITWSKIPESASVAPGNQVYAYSSSGNLYAWGAETGGVGVPYSVPTQISAPTGPSSTYRSIISGLNSWFGIDNDGSLWQWGNGTSIELGNGNNAVTQTLSTSVQLPNKFVAIPQIQPIPAVLNASSYTMVNSYNTTFAIRPNGTLLAWGSNNFGQLTSPVTQSPTNSEFDLAALGSWTMISQGISHVVGIKSDGTLWSWGGNTLGQLGDGTTVHKSSPVQIGSSTYSMVKTWNLGTVAITTDGKLFTWGAGTLGTIGDGTTISKSSPVQVAAGSSFAAVGASASNIFATNSSDGSLWSWGDNTLGQLGINLAAGATNSRSTPQQITAGSFLSPTVIVDPSSNTIFVKKTATDIWAWGAGTAYQIPGVTTNTISPIQVTALSNPLGSIYQGGAHVPTKVINSGISTAFVGQSHIAALTTTGAIYTWGFNPDGRLGLGDTIYRSSPTQVGSSSYVAITAGNSFMLAIGSDNTLYGWGNNTPPTSGVFPMGHPTPGATNSWIAIDAGGYFTAGSYIMMGAIRQDGTLWTWGQNSSGTLGLGDTINRSSPTQLGSQSNWTQISVGHSMMTALNSLGQAYTWGVNYSSGALGDGTTTSKSNPVQVMSGTSFTFVAARKYSTTGGWAGIDNLGKLWVAGPILTGDGTTLARSNPVQITTSVPAGATGSWKFVSGGGYGWHAISSDDRLFGWGTGVGGTIGDGTTINRSFPTQIGTTFISPWATVSSGFSSVFATAMTDAVYGQLGNLYAWGLNTNGELGVNDRISRSAPTQVTSLDRSFTMVKTLVGATWALTTDNKLFGWGYANQSGLIGDNSTINRSSPVQVGTGISFTILGAATAIANTGLAYLFPANNSVSLGLAPNTPSAQTFSAPVMISGWNIPLTSAPVQVSTSAWAAIMSGGSQTVATRTSATGGSLWAWGGPFGGSIIGNNSIAGSPAIRILNTDVTGFGVQERVRTPTLLTNISDVAQVATGTSFAYALKTNGTLWQQTVSTNYLSGIGVGTGVGWQQVPGSWSQVKATQFSSNIASIALKTDGTIWGWGVNANGLFGTNSQGNSYSSPVQLGTSLGLTPPGSYYANFEVNTKPYLNVSPTSALSFGSSDFTIETFISVSTSLKVVYPIVIASKSSSDDSSLKEWVFGLTGPTLAMYFKYSTDGANYTTITSSTITLFEPGTWYHVAVTRTTTSISFWLNGTLVNTNTTFPATLYSSTSNLLKIGYSTNVGNPNDPLSGALNNFRIVNGTQVYTGTFTPANTNLTAVTNTALLTFQSATVVDNSTNAYTLNSISSVNPYAIISNATFAMANLSLQSSWTQVYVAYNFAAATRADGWTYLLGGYNGQGALGIGDTISRSTPVAIGQGYENIILAASSVYTWGTQKAGGYTKAKMLMGTGNYNNGTGNQQLEQGNASSNRSSPVVVGLASTTYMFEPMQLPFSDLTNLSLTTGKVAWNSTLQNAQYIKSDGSLFAWGDNAGGQLGLVDNIARSSPVQVGGQLAPYATQPSELDPTSTTSYSLVNAGPRVQSAIGTTGKLWQWGYGSGISNSYTNTLVWKQLVTTNNGSFAIKTDGTLWTFGSTGAGGQDGLGVLAGTGASSPVQITSGNPTGSWKMVRAQASTAAAISTDGSLWVWGVNDKGQLGLGDTINRVSPVQVGIGNSYLMVSVGGDTVSAHVAAIRNDNTLWVWGFNNAGQLGQSDTVNRSSPTQVPGYWNQAIASNNNYQIAALNKDYIQYAWGWNGNGALGDGTTIYKSSPVAVGSTTFRWQKLASSTWGYANYAIKYDGTLWSWGVATYGLLGNAQVTVNRSSPGQVLAGGVGLGTGNGGVIPNTVRDHRWTDVQGVFESGTAGYVIAQRVNGPLYGWGGNQFGALGLGDAVSRSQPIQIGVPVVRITGQAPGFYTSLNYSTNPLYNSKMNQSINVGQTAAILTKEGDIYQSTNARGNSYILVSTLQKGGYPLLSVPTQIGNKSWNGVSSGYDTTIAVDNLGTLFTWGRNSSQQTGSSLITGVLQSPVAISTLAKSNVVEGNQNTDPAINLGSSNLQVGKGSTGYIKNA